MENYSEKIKLIAFDVDGVLTDGRVYIDALGNEMKSISLKEIDSVNSLKRSGYKIAAITGENTPIVKYFKDRFPWDYFYSGCKDKLAIIREIENLECIKPHNICYIGDGKYDVSALEYVGLGVCPADGCNEAKRSANIVLRGLGGVGCVQELEGILT